MNCRNFSATVHKSVDQNASVSTALRPPLGVRHAPRGTNKICIAQFSKNKLHRRMVCRVAVNISEAFHRSVWCVIILSDTPAICVTSCVTKGSVSLHLRYIMPIVPFRQTSQLSGCVGLYWQSADSCRLPDFTPPQSPLVSLRFSVNMGSVAVIPLPAPFYTIPLSLRAKCRFNLASSPKHRRKLRR